MITLGLIWRIFVRYARLVFAITSTRQVLEALVGEECMAGSFTKTLSVWYTSDLARYLFVEIILCATHSRLQILCYSFTQWNLQSKRDLDFSFNYLRGKWYTRI